MRVRVADRLRKWGRQKSFTFPIRLTDLEWSLWTLVRDQHFDDGQEKFSCGAADIAESIAYGEAPRVLRSLGCCPRHSREYRERRDYIARAMAADRKALCR